MAELLGSVTLSKRLRDHPVWERMDYGYCWVDLLMLANDRPRRATANGTFYDLKRGQLIWSKKSLETEWRKSGEWLDKFLTFCQDEGMITVDADRRRTIITVLNYDAYNPLEPASDTATDTDTEPASDTERNGEMGSEKGNGERARAEKSTKDFDVVPSENEKKIPPATDQPVAVSRNKKNGGHPVSFLDGRTPAQARFEIGKELEAVSGRLDAAAELGIEPDAADKRREKDLKAALAAIGKE